MNKKATTIPWEFILGLLITIIFFVPACLIISDIIRYTNEAKESFNNFAVMLDNMNQARNENLELASVVLDDATAVIYFESQERVEVGIEPEGYAPYVVYFEKPELPECIGKSCICLLREFKVEYDPRGLGAFTVKPVTFWCKQSPQSIKYNPIIEDPIRKYNSCGSGKPINIKHYYCKQGFIIEKNIIKKIISSSPKNSYFELSAARTILTVTKEKNNIILESD